MSDVRITTIRFENFKSLRGYTVSLQDRNILVGPNNAGKSTIISSLRLLEVALRRAKSKSAERVKLPDGTTGFGHNLSLAHLSVSLENVATDYNSEHSLIEFRLSNRNKLVLFFPSDGGCTLCWKTEGPAVTTAGRFSSEFPISVQVVPVLGPLEHREAYVNQQTVREALSTHRASRHFRNYWHYFPEGWGTFAEMVADTWPGMRIKPPEIDVPNRQLSMFVSEDRIDREVYWAGFGFQIWCQLLTHISRASGATLLAIDEPEIYLHPDVQRQLLAILRRLDADVVLATHSVEIIGEADPSELVLIQKGKQMAQRLRDIEGVQTALDSIGSAQNVTLAHLARTRKVLFVEQMDDFKTLRRFARVLGLSELSTGNDLTAFESGGSASLEKVKSFAWGVKRAVDAKIKIFAVFGRAYFCSEEVRQIESDLAKEFIEGRVLVRKEIDNYLLHAEVLSRAVRKQLEQKTMRQGTVTKLGKSLEAYLQELSEPYRNDMQSQFISKHLAFHASSGIDIGAVSKQLLHEFEQNWLDLDRRMIIAPGKLVLKALRESLKADLGINLTLVQIVDEFRATDIPADLVSFLRQLDYFRTQ